METEVITVLSHYTILVFDQFVLMYPINSMESYGRIAVLESESKEGIEPLRHDIPQNELSYAIIVCNNMGNDSA